MKARIRDHSRPSIDGAYQTSSRSRSSIMMSGISTTFARAHEHFTAIGAMQDNVPERRIIRSNNR